MLTQSIIGKLNDKSTKLLSLDIFDTLVFRLVDHPHQIFYEIGKKAIKSNLLHRSITAEDFALLRIKAEQDARKCNRQIKGHSEVTLQQIYEFLPEFIDDSAKLQSLEVMTECEYCYLNSEILDLIKDSKSRNLPVVLTSDMYLNKTQLKQILKSNGFDLKLIKEIYISCENNGNKSSGLLFHKLQTDFPKVPSENILHIGDKFEADIESPRSLGINAFHYDVIAERLKEVCEYEKICQTSPKYINSLRKFAVNLSQEPDSIEVQVGAGVLGPVLTLFCDWVLDICEKEGKKNIFPLMREAEIFEPLLKNAAKKRNMDLNISSLYVSRESTWLPSLNEWNKEECENLLAKTRITVGDVFKFIASDIPSFIEKKYIHSKIKD